MNWDPVTHYKAVEVARRYDAERFSSSAGKFFNALEKRHVRRMFNDVPRSAKVLDMPCGTGRFAEVLLDMGFNVTGVDISEAMLQVAREKLDRFGQAFITKAIDVRELAKQAPKSFDIALCARFLMHFPLEKQVEFLRAVTALTRRTIVLTQSYSSGYQRLRRRVKRTLFDSQPSSHPIEESELQLLLQQSGLREVRRVRPMPLLTEVIYVVAEPR